MCIRDRYRAGSAGEAPVLDAAASYDPESRAASVFVVNRSLSDEVDVHLEFADVQVAGVTGVDLLTGDDPKQANSWEQRESVVPVPGKATVEDGRAHVTVPSLGLAVVKLIL